MVPVCVWPSIPRAVTTVWRMGRRTPATLYRFMWCGPNVYRRDTSLFAGPGSLREHGSGQLFSDPTDDFQVLDVLLDSLKQSSGKAA